MSLRAELCGYAWKALVVAGLAVAVAGLAVGMGFLALWGGLHALGIRTGGEVSAADLLSGAVAFATLVATVVLTFAVAKLGAEQARKDAAGRVEKDFALRHAEVVLERLAVLLGLLRRAEGGVTYVQALEAADEVGTALADLNSVLALLEHPGIQKEVEALQEGKGNQLFLVRDAIAQGVDDPAQPMAEMQRKRASQFAKEIVVKVREAYIRINRA